MKVPRGELLRDLLHRHGETTLPVSGASMSPTLADGGTIRVVACQRPAVGDVVLFEAGEKLVAHRLVARAPHPRRLFLQHGDGAKERPAWLYGDHILGRVLLPRRPPSLPAQMMSLVRAALPTLVHRWKRALRSSRS